MSRRYAPRTLSRLRRHRRAGSEVKVALLPVLQGHVIARMKILMQVIIWAKSVLRFEIAPTNVSKRSVACRNLRFGLP